MNHNHLSRRRLLKHTLSCSVLASTLLLDGCSRQILSALQDPKRRDHFAFGVASGDPTQTSIILWTRVNGMHISSQKKNTSVEWELSADNTFEKILQYGQIHTNAAQDFTVKVDVTGLQPGQTYYYRFRHQGIESEPGRTKTLPEGNLEQLGLAIASCSNYAYGFFNAYEVIAADPDIDFVLHLGDYIYEYGQDGWGAETGRQLNRNHFPAHEIVSLQDYRQRHGQYKSDLASRYMHAMHPLIPTWDDHESANNPWMHGAQNHQANEGSWSDRKNASVQAYYEWMPVREPQKGLNRDQFWRHYSFGNLASLVTLETRHTGRSLQIDYSDHLAGIQSSADRQHFLDKILGDPRRTMLSSAMEAFYTDSMQQSLAAGQPWRLIGNQIPIAKTHVPNLQNHLKREVSKGYDPVAEEHAQFERLGKLDLPIYLDTWDGYPAAREKFYNMNQKLGIQDLLVLTGDSHSFWANQLFDSRNQSMGLELGTAGISSPGDFESYGTQGAETFDRLLAQHNKEIVWTHCRHRGFIKLMLQPEQAQAHFIAVSSVMSEKYESFTLKTMKITPTGDTLTYS